MPVSVWPSLSSLYDGTMKSLASVKEEQRDQSHRLAWEYFTATHTAQRAGPICGSVHTQTIAPDSSEVFLRRSSMHFAHTFAATLQPPSMHSLISVLVPGAVPKGYTGMTNEIFGPRGIRLPDFPDNCTPLRRDLHSTLRPLHICYQPECSLFYIVPF